MLLVNKDLHMQSIDRMLPFSISLNATHNPDFMSTPCTIATMRQRQLYAAVSIEYLQSCTFSDFKVSIIQRQITQKWYKIELYYV